MRLRANLAGQMDRVCEGHAPLIITRKASPSVVMISLDDYEAGPLTRRRRARATR
ncbi:MAG: type II toxin-antitoxin system Phd/YefM family antitoxin [Mycobacteriaceae bacterium]